MINEEKTTGPFVTAYMMTKLPCRLQAVPFWIVERSREIAELANERRGAWGEAEKGERKRKGLRSWL